MAPSLFFQAVLATIHAFQAFDYIYILTRTGNGNSSLPTLVFSIYREGFRFFRMGDAAAQAVVLTGDDPRASPGSISGCRNAGGRHEGEARRPLGLCRAAGQARVLMVGTLRVDDLDLAETRWPSSSTCD